jgi:hypothetical protein
MSGVRPVPEAATSDTDTRGSRSLETGVPGPTTMVIERPRPDLEES